MLSCLELKQNACDEEIGALKQAKAMLSGADFNGQLGKKHYR